MSSPPTAQVPSDLQGARAQQIQLLNYLLFGNAQAGNAGGSNPLANQKLGRGAPGSGGVDFSTSGADVQNRLESFFGSLGGQAPGAPDPTVNAQNFLNNLLTQKPGQGIIDAAQPGFDRNLALANQEGARFGSNNAILRSRAVDDFNVLSANAAQQGINQQLAASQGLGVLANDQFGRTDLATQRRLQILFQLLAQLQGPTLGAPVQAGRSALDNIGQAVGTGLQIASTAGAFI